MPLEEHIACGPQVNSELVDLSRDHQGGLFLRVAITRADDSFRQVLCETIRSHVYELRREIRIHGGRFCKKLQRNRAGDFRILRKSWSRVDQDIVPRLHRTLISRTRWHVLTVAAQRTANRGPRPRRIINIMIRRVRMLTLNLNAT